MRYYLSDGKEDYLCCMYKNGVYLYLMNGWQTMPWSILDEDKVHVEEYARTIKWLKLHGIPLFKIEGM